MVVCTVASSEGLAAEQWQVMGGLTVSSKAWLLHEFGPELESVCTGTSRLHQMLGTGWRGMAASMVTCSYAAVSPDCACC